MDIALIVAVAENGVIGKDGGLPWRLSSDLKTFRRLTMGKPMIMGRRTFQSIGKPLDGRDNIVVTRDPGFAPEGVSTTDNVTDALTLARVLGRTRGADEIMVIGGEAELIENVFGLLKRVYLTVVHREAEGDYFFPTLDPREWSKSLSERLMRAVSDDADATLIMFEKR